MIAALPVTKPVVMALRKRLGKKMDVILHIGAHRTGSTTFQAYMRANSDALDRANIAFWGPRRTRNGLFRGLTPNTGVPTKKTDMQKRAQGRVQLRLDQARRNNKTAVLVSDENMIGTGRMCLRSNQLYPGIGERMARFQSAFGDSVSRIVLCTRSQDRFWASAIAYAVSRGYPVPGHKKLHSIASAKRSWRDVVSDLACAMPNADIRVLPYEVCYANPVILARKAAGLDVQFTGEHEWLNRSPELPKLRRLLQERGQDPAILPEGDGVWQPFDEEQRNEMRETYADDLFWLARGADGLAKLTEEAMPRERGQARHAGNTKGHGHDEKGCLDKTG